MKYFSMFSGIGGFELGINQAYVETITRETDGGVKGNSAPNAKAGKGLVSKKDETARTKGGRSGKHSDIGEELRQPTCVGYSEIDKYAIQIYEKHFSHKNYGDATRIDPTEIADFDLLVGGFPCQAFSIAGKRRGLEDTRGTLFYDICRIAKEKRPKHLLLENVKGLLSHDGGRTFKTIITAFAELGYRMEWQVLNSKNFGVPQNRERVFIIGHLGACCGRQVFPLRANDQQVNELSGHISNTLTARYEGAQATGTYIGEGELDAQEIHQLNKPKHSNDRVYGMGGVAPTLNTMQGGNRQPFIANGMKIRRLTPTECERLQAYPDGWTKFGKPILVDHGENDIEDISDTQRYKTLGNGVTVNVIQHLIKQLIYE